MGTITGYCMGLKKVVEIANPEIVTMKNGRKAVRGVAAEAPEYKVFRILGNSEAADVEAGPRGVAGDQPDGLAAAAAPYHQVRLLLPQGEIGHSPLLRSSSQGTP